MIVAASFILASLTASALAAPPDIRLIAGEMNERDLYDPAKQLWKVERWEQISVVDGVPTALRVSMEDRLAKTRTDIDVSAVRYDVPLPEGLLEPAQLPKATASSLWNELGG